MSDQDKQDLLDAITETRNALSNSWAQALAQLKAAQRRIAELEPLEKKVADLEAQVAKLTAAAEESVTGDFAHVGNGHDRDGAVM